ncbi:MAG: DUF4403 family protein, partial [Bacteroidota bacterium]
EVNLDIKAGYDSLTTILSKEIAGKSVEVKNNMVIFDSIRIESAAGNKLNIRVNFSGKKKGTLFLVGTPTFDVENQVISFPDLEFDIKTKNALLKSAEWIFSSRITDLFRQQAHFDLKPQLMRLKEDLNKEINREIAEKIFLNGKIDAMSVEGIYPSGNTLIIRASAVGNLSLKM